MGYEELHAAWLAFRRHKKPSRSIDEFAYYLEANLRLLVQDIGQHTYRHGTYQTVVVHEKKRRDLAVASVRDRVVHRLVYDELVRVFNPTLDPDVWSCRPKKGLYGCLERTQGLLRRHVDAYVWRIDIAKFLEVNLLAGSLPSLINSLFLCSMESKNATKTKLSKSRISITVRVKLLFKA